MPEYKTYKISPFINDSFEETFNFIIKSLFGYNVKNISPDAVSEYDSYDSLKWFKPKYIYLTVNYMNKTSWTNYGGFYYCELLKKDTKILINWSVNPPNEDYELLDIKVLRKIKLNKISKSNLKCDVKFPIFTESNITEGN